MPSVVFEVAGGVARFDQQVVQATIAVQEPLVATDVHPDLDGTHRAMADEVKDDGVAIVQAKGARLAENMAKEIRGAQPCV